MKLRPLVVLFLGAVAPAAAAITVAPLFTDHAVLQRDKPVPVWGQAMPGERIVVQFHGLNAFATADSTGAWKALLPSLPASNVPSDLVIRGASTLTLHDLVVGEVWLCSGQSSWECHIWDPKRAMFRVLNGKTEVAAANHPLIRQFAVSRAAAAAPPTHAGGIWEVCFPTTVLHFSAVGYFFARDIYRQLSIPVGIIDSTQAGTPLQFRMSCETGGMIQPLIPYALRGMLWDQGAADAAVEGVQENPKLFAALITDWRASFGQGDVPFYWVQRASLGQNPEWRALRETQQTLKLPNTGRALAIDLGPENNGRPQNEQEVGRRLALLAASRVYGLPVECSGPKFAGIQVEGSAMRVRFDFAGSGLKASQPVATCDLAGADRKFYPATAVIDGKTLVVRSAQVPQPVAVRYGWTGNGEGHLYNAAGLPAMPFRSDDW